MATSEALMAVVGSPVDSEAVRQLIAADGLASSTEPNYGDGEPPRSYLSGPAVGYQFMHVGGRIATAFLYTEPAEGFAAFPGPLPGGLPRGTTRREVLARFGTPQRSGKAVTITGLGRQGGWDRFAVGGVLVHFQYAEPGERVRLVSVMAADLAP